MIPFPLAEGEAFGRGRWCTFSRLMDLDNVRPRLALLTWQRYVTAAWRVHVPATGVWDASCTQAVFKIQGSVGIPPSGVLDAETWLATWEGHSSGQAPEGHSVPDSS